MPFFTDAEKEAQRIALQREGYITHDDYKVAALKYLAVVSLIGDKKIEAIKYWRQATGLGLKEAKDAVENLQTFVKPVYVKTPGVVEAPRVVNPITTEELNTINSRLQALEEEMDFISKLVPKLNRKVKALGT